MENKIIEIRRARPDDAEFIIACFGLPHVAPFMRMPKIERVREAMRDPATASFIIEQDARPVGHLLMRDLAKNWRIAEFSQILVSEQRRGYGRAGVEFAKQFAFVERNAHRLCLEVVAENTGACALYEACGFLREGTFRDGFPADDGTFCDLAAYGMLDLEYQA